MSPVQVWFLAYCAKPLVAMTFRGLLFNRKLHFSYFQWCSKMPRRIFLGEVGQIIKAVMMASLYGVKF
ncbi:MAG: hypothetical protein PUP92_40155 [Rhizonema sp. PD38]|nr:hypothetical protein [Rhizonema sp. PD38]